MSGVEEFVQRGLKESKCCFCLVECAQTISMSMSVRVCLSSLVNNILKTSCLFKYSQTLFSLRSQDCARLIYVMIAI